MNIRINLDKQTAEGFVAFAKVAKPPEMSLDDFAKNLFMLGANTLQKELAREVEKFKKENPEEFDKLLRENSNTSSL